MKKNKTICVIAGLGVLLTIASCNKEQMQPQSTAENNVVLPAVSNASQDAQRAFLADLRSAVRETTQRDLDPNNASNTYDFYGQYFSEMINWLLDNFDLQSLSFEEYSAIVEEYMAEHPLPTFETNYALSETDLELVKISREIAGNQSLSVDGKIAQLKMMESLIADTPVFSEAAKEIILISVSISKHLSVVGQSNGVSQTAFMSCFDGEFNSCMHERMDALFNTQNADFNIVDTVLYCGGLPVNVAQDVAACAWSAAWAC
jgi:hypothetical protein